MKRLARLLKERTSLKRMIASKKTVFSLFVLIISSLFLKAQVNSNDYSVYLETITAEDLSKHLYIYASDSLQGRGAGQEGHLLAIDYLSSFYKKKDINFHPKQEDYFQKFRIIKAPPSQYTLEYSHRKFASNKDLFTPFRFPSVVLDLEKLYYTNSKENTSQNLDVVTWNKKGQIILYHFEESENLKEKSSSSKDKPYLSFKRIQNTLLRKIETLKKEGAQALLIHADFGETKIEWNGKPYKSIFDIFKKIRYGSGLNGGYRIADIYDIDFPVFFVGKGFLERNNIQLEKHKKRELIKARGRIDYSYEAEIFESNNVLAYIQGNEKPEEVLVLSAHLDHLGREGEIIYNGADDDGSGTVAILEIAEAFQKAAKDGKRPKRSILFLHASAEELGLIGSRYYTENPLFSLDKTIANLNIDMIGRTDIRHIGAEKQNYIYSIGGKRTSKQLHKISENTNQNLGKLEIDYRYDAPSDPNNFFRRSDHYNFAKNGVPTIFYFAGIHPDYHKPTDDPERINYDLLAKRTQLIFATAWELAYKEELLK